MLNFIKTIIALFKNIGPLISALSTVWSIVKKMFGGEAEKPAPDIADAAPSEPKKPRRGWFRRRRR